MRCSNSTRICFSGLGLLLSVAASGVAAQGAGRLVPDAVVRWTNGPSGAQLSGRIKSIRGDAVVVATGVAGQFVEVGPWDLDGMEVRVGRRSRLRGAGIGLIAGAAMGGMVGFIAGTDDCTGKFLCFSRGETAAALGMAFSGLGALIGLVVSPGWRWEPLTEADAVGREARIQSRSVGPVLTWKSGPAVGLRVTF